MDEKLLDALYSANFKTAFSMIKAALPWLKKSGEGHIVNATGTRDGSRISG